MAKLKTNKQTNKINKYSYAFGTLQWRSLDLQQLVQSGKMFWQSKDCAIPWKLLLKLMESTLQGISHYNSVEPGNI